jgi:hypothetical protein
MQAFVRLFSLCSLCVACSRITVLLHNNRDRQFAQALSTLTAGDHSIQHTLNWAVEDTSCAMQAWNFLILMLDALYTALWVPIVSTFELPHSITSPSGATDFVVGIILLIDICIRFHSPITLTSTYKQLLLSHPRSVAHFYMRRGSFLLDVLAAVPLVVLPWINASRNYLLLVLALRLVRLVRVRRVIDMLFYIQVRRRCCIFALRGKCEGMACDLYMWICKGETQPDIDCSMTCALQVKCCLFTQTFGSMCQQ